eukprot:m.324303 g.324303  ORF g.324303 m.324303 type:complete len:359 (+) comp20372_c1_seq3:89-1165(+)
MLSHPQNMCQRCLPVLLFLIVSSEPRGILSVYDTVHYDVNVSMHTYGKGKYCSGSLQLNGTQNSEVNCTVVDLVLDAYLPNFAKTDESDLPVVLYIHGGSYTHGGRTDGAPFCNYFASRGWAAFSIDYRLCGGEKGLVCHQFGNSPDGWGIPTGAPKYGSFFGAPAVWMYPAVRDAKAAVRWLRANAENFGISADHITTNGGSAGAVSSIALGVTNEDDYKTEISPAEDPTLTSTNLEQSSHVATTLSQWGGDYGVVYVTSLAPGASNKTRYSTANPPMAMYHGDQDGVININQTRSIQHAYASTGVPLTMHVLVGCGHGADNCNVTAASCSGCPPNQTQFDSMHAFIVKHQHLTVRH